MGERFAGRKPGTPNKSTAKLKAFLDGVFSDAFEQPEFRARLLKQVVSLEIDNKLFATLLAYWAGRPPQALDHRVEGTLSLAQLIVGETPADDETDSEE